MWYIFLFIAVFIISLGFNIDKERRKYKKTLERMKEEEEWDYDCSPTKSPFSHYPVDEDETPTETKPERSTLDKILHGW